MTVSLYSFLKRIAMIDYSIMSARQRQTYHLVNERGEILTTFNTILKEDVELLLDDQAAEFYKLVVDDKYRIIQESGLWIRVKKVVS